MIFAEMEYPSTYTAFHAELEAFLARSFSNVKSGILNDSWFWIFDEGEKVAIDTFSSMKHQIKSAKPGPHVQRVIEVLSSKYKLNVYEEPVLEGHE